MHLTMLRYLTDAGRLYHRLLAPAREAAGLTQAELDILLFLANNPEYDTASDIVAVRRLAKSNVSVGVKNLEVKGLLYRRSDTQDRRIEHLSLAPAAARPIELGREGQRRFGAVLQRGFSSEDRAELEHLMTRIQKNISQALDGPDCDHRKEEKPL